MSTFTNLLYHIVYSTKYRQPLIAPIWQDELHRYIGGIIRERDGIALQVGGMPDHVHVLAKLSPKRAIMDVLRDVKAGSSKWVNESGHVRGRFEWQTGYGAFSVSQSQVDRVTEYIRMQDRAPSSDHVSRGVSRPIAAPRNRVRHAICV